MPTVPAGSKLSFYSLTRMLGVQRNGIIGYSRIMRTVLEYSSTGTVLNDRGVKDRSRHSTFPFFPFSDATLQTFGRMLECIRQC